MREELYAQCFDELIRQITINCPERGLLLLALLALLRSLRYGSPLLLSGLVEPPLRMTMNEWDRDEVSELVRA